MDFGSINYSALQEQHVIFEDSSPLEESPTTPCLSYKATKWGGGGLHTRPQNQRLCVHQVWHDNDPSRLIEFHHKRPLIAALHRQLCRP